MITVESAAYPDLHTRVQATYDEMVRGQQVPHEVLSEILGEASGKGVLRAIQQKYSATAHEAMMMPLSIDAAGTATMFHRGCYGGRQL